MACQWSLDGEKKGTLQPEDRTRVPVDFGGHLVEAVASEGGYRWEKVYAVREPGITVVTIAMREQMVVWKDPATGPMWTRRDNGSGVTWQQARDYCSSLNSSRHAGSPDWRLPEIGELEGIYDPSIPAIFKVKSPLQVSACCPWSATLKSAASGEAWTFDFNSGRRYSDLLGNDDLLRALCVRRSGE